MKKGFTLVELLAVISLIATITVVAIPGVNKVREDVNKSMFCKKVELVLSAAERYAEEHKNALSLRNNNIEDGSPCLVNKTLRELIDAGVIESESTNIKSFKNPLTKEEMLDDIVAFYMKDENVYAIYQEDEASMIEGQKKYKELCDVKDEDHKYEVNLCGVEHRTKREDEEQKLTSIDIFESTIKVNDFKVKSSTSGYNNRVVKIESSITGDASPKVCVSTTGFGVGCNYENYNNSISLTLANSDDAYKNGDTYTIYVALKASNGSLTTVKGDYKLYKYCDSESSFNKVSDNKSTCGKCGVATYKESQKTNDKYFSSVSCSTRDVDKSCDHPSCCGSGNEKDVYTSWSTCSKKCNTGTQTRTYKVVSKWDETKVCKNSVTQTQNCNTTSCCSGNISDYTYTDSANWSSCTANNGVCGTGKKYKTRTYYSKLDSSVVCQTSNTANVTSCETTSCATTFNYTGGVQTFTAPYNGVFTLEAYGAQGGSIYSMDTHKYGWGVINFIGGKGGYATGKIRLTKGQKLYIAVGGKGTDKSNFRYDFDTTSTGTNGGYNGGGKGGNSSVTSCPGMGGGGATSITTTNRGVLANFNSYRSEILLVAGGGGGGAFNGTPGAGGGSSGGTGKCSVASSSPTSPGGTQSSGYSFGVGQVGRNAVSMEDSSCEGNGGGGGGYFGGKTTSSTGQYSDNGGGGGSGYTSTSLSSRSMSNGVQSSNGKAVITYYSS